MTTEIGFSCEKCHTRTKHTIAKNDVQPEDMVQKCLVCGNTMQLGAIVQVDEQGGPVFGQRNF